MSVRRRVLVSGRVQGVFYRDSCRRRAEQEGVSGWVRNLHDGRVEACFEGPDDAVDRMVRWTREGSGPARVTSIEVHEEDPEGDAGFAVF